MSNDNRELRKRAEKLAALEESSAPGEKQKTIHEMRVHQIELEMKNEELRRTQEELLATKAKYYDLYDLAPIGYITLSDKILILEANLASSLLLGVERANLAGQLFSRFIDHQDQDLFYLNFKSLLESGTQVDFELRLVHKAGTVTWIRIVIEVNRIKGSPLECRAILTEIAKRKEAENKINALLAEKQLILQEVHHRIKNNLNTIYSLLILQAGKFNDLKAVAALEDAGNRVQCMLLLYNKLYQSAGFSELSIAKYLPSLADEIVSNFPNCESVRVDKKVEDFILDAKTLQVIGIIVNELFTNIMKYAFSGRGDGLITLSASKRERTVSVVIADNGNGMPESVNFDNSTGFGLVLVGSLTRQLNGRIRIVRNKGTAIILEFER